MLQLCNVTTAFIGNQIKTPNDPEQSASVAVILSGAGLVSQTSCLLKINVLQLNYFLSSWVFSWKMHFSWSWQEGKKEEVPSDAKPTDVPLKSVCIKNPEDPNTSFILGEMAFACLVSFISACRKLCVTASFLQCSHSRLEVPKLLGSGWMGNMTKLLRSDMGLWAPGKGHS